MRSYNSILKVYKRKNAKQYIITLKQDNPFKEGETLIIYPESDLNQSLGDNITLEDFIKLRNDIINDLKKDNKSLEDFKSKYETLRNDYDKLEGNKNHFEKLYTKSLKDINKLQTELRELDNELNQYRSGVKVIEKDLKNIDFNYEAAINNLNTVSVWDRLRKKYPDNLELVKANIQDFKQDMELLLITGKTEDGTNE